jgi:tetratricopeptide (TPR) repeat protein
MPVASTIRSLLAIALIGAPLLVAAQQPAQQPAQQAPPNPRADSNRTASRLDTDGKTREAREIFQKLIDGAPDAAARAASQRAMAMSFAFDGDCRNTVKYEEMVIAYWKTREQAEPQNAFYQQGEMANEAARVCIDAGDLKTAERYYRRGTELGLKEPEPKTHSANLWHFRLEHALARIASRTGSRAKAMEHVAAARKLLDSDTALATAQSRFYPYLVGYVALHTGDLTTAEAELTKAIAMRGNERDPFFHALLAMTHEKMGHADAAKPLWQKAYDLATAHNPPAAYTRPLARKKLGLP